MIVRRFLALCLLSLATPAMAATISYVPQTSTVLIPGGSVTVKIYGSSIDAIAGYSLYLDSSASGSLIQVTSQTLNTSLFTYGGPGPSLPETISDTHTSHDLGAFSNSSLPANTLYLLSTATFTLDLTTPYGAYSIGNTAATVFTSDFIGSDYATIASFNITVIPEPSMAGAVMTGCLVIAVGWRRLSRRHSRA
jgi:hypothetical protein